MEQRTKYLKECSGCGYLRHVHVEDGCWMRYCNACRLGMRALVLRAEATKLDKQREVILARRAKGGHGYARKERRA